MPILLITQTGNKQGQKWDNHHIREQTTVIFHTHRQIKLKEKLTKTPTNMDKGKTRNKKHEKGSNKIGRSNFFYDGTHFKPI